jgi:hypothetical protein
MIIILSDRSIVLTGLLTCGKTNAPIRHWESEIAQSVEALGDKFFSAMRWLKYIQTTYAAGPGSAAAFSTGQGTWVLTDNELWCPASAPAKGAHLCNE